MTLPLFISGEPGEPSEPGVPGVSGEASELLHDPCPSYLVAVRPSGRTVANLLTAAQRSNLSNLSHPSLLKDKMISCTPKRCQFWHF